LHRRCILYRRSCILYRGRILNGSLLHRCLLNFRLLVYRCLHGLLRRLTINRLTLLRCWLHRHIALHIRLSRCCTAHIHTACLGNQIFYILHACF